LDGYGAAGDDRGGDTVWGSGGGGDTGAVEAQVAVVRFEPWKFESKNLSRSTTAKKIDFA
jgi:hypothetical protein